MLRLGRPLDEEPACFQRLFARGKPVRWPNAPGSKAAGHFSFASFAPGDWTKIFLSFNSPLFHVGRFRASTHLQRSRRWLPAARILGYRSQVGIRGNDLQRGVDADTVGPARYIQLLAEFGDRSKQTVGEHDTAQTIALRPPQHCQGQLPFGLIAHAFWNTSLVAARAILTPSLRQIQFRINSDHVSAS